MLQRLVDNLGLVALEYGVDRRTRIFGQRCLTTSVYVAWRQFTPVRWR